MTCRAVRDGCLAGAALALALAASPAVRAAPFSWSETGGGSFQTSTNWSPDGVPGASDNVIVDLDATYTITFDAPTTENLRFEITDGDVTFDLQNGDYELADTQLVSVRIANFTNDVASLTVVGGGVVAAETTIIGALFGSDGSLTLSGAQTRWINGGTLIVGDFGVGSCVVEAGARLTNQTSLIIGRGFGSTALVRVTGAASSIVGAAPISIGEIMPSQSADEPASESRGGLVPAALSVESGARSASASVVIGQRGRLQGDGEVESILVTNKGEVAPGVDGVGELSLIADYTQTAGGSLVIEIGPGAHDRLVIDGDAALDGEIQVTFVGGFTPAVGQVFEVLSATDVTGAFSATQLPDLGMGAGVVVEQSATAVTVRITEGGNPYDLTGDGVVGPPDLGFLLGLWGTDDQSADFDESGVVGPPDLGILLGAWTQ